MHAEIIHNWQDLNLNTRSMSTLSHNRGNNFPIAKRVNLCV